MSWALIDLFRHCLIKGLLSNLRTFGLQFGIVFGILFILVACHSEFDLYLCSFLSAGSTFNSSKNSSFLLWSERVYPAVLKNLILNDVSRGGGLGPFFWGSKFCVLINNVESQCITYLYSWKFLDQSWLKVSFRVPSIWEHFSFCWILFILLGNFTTEIFKVLYLL